MNAAGSREMTMKTVLERQHAAPTASVTDLKQDAICEFHAEEHLRQLLYLERKRRDRSGRALLLMLINISKISDDERDTTARTIARVLALTTRTIDLKGWYDDNHTIGVIFNECNATDKQEIVNKIRCGLERGVAPAFMQLISLSIHTYPSEDAKSASGVEANPVLYPEVSTKYNNRRGQFLVKRAVDIAGSLVGLVLFSPFLLVIPALIKLTSPGPVLFRQARVGLYGKKFLFYKFRTMYLNNDERIHREYVQKLISGKAAPEAETCRNDNSSPSNETHAERGAPVFKITNDARITRIGRILRKTSLDELPQFLNVLLGDMSLVGPRPPIPYEVQNYDTWHRSRVIEVKPGITGLWQVRGRSATTFDEMVRLDIKYSREWSLWLDIKILAATPWVVLKGKGAY